MKTPVDKLYRFMLLFIKDPNLILVPKMESYNDFKI
jgi:hypothetical protein